MMEVNENGKAVFQYESLGSRGTYPVEVNLVADARDVVGLAGFPWIVLAANPHLSNDKIYWFLATCGIDGVERSASWIQRHRFMFRRASQHPHNTAGRSRDRDHARAVEIMKDHRTISARQMVHVLKARGIKRSKDWVLRNRCG
jgi:hypothetical protein